MPAARRTLALLLLPVLLAALAACSTGGKDTTSPKTASSPTATPDPEPAKGTCWDDEQLPAALGDDGFIDWVEKYARGDQVLADSLKDDAAFTNQIDCAAPHSLEVYNVVQLDGRLASRIGEYADLLDQSTPLFHQVRDQVNDRCVQGTPYGAAQQKAKLAVQLGPALDAKGGLHVAWDPYPADRWNDGEQKFVCTFEQDTPGTLRFADLTTTKVPVVERVCLNTPGTYVPCAGKHQAEDIGEMILNTPIARGQINGTKAIRTGPQGKYVALTEAEYAKLDRVCQNLLAAVSTAKGGISARAYPGAVDQWPTENGAYVASCFALKPFDPPPPITGTVFDR